MLVEDVSPVVQDYLKVIWAATEWSADPVTTKHLAHKLGVRSSTVSEQVQRMVTSGLLVHERYAAIMLTDEGRKLAVSMVRRHRLIETFLVNHLGYDWDEVHDEAEVLEHAVSPTLVQRLADFLGHPERDPHGDPIPDANGAIAPTTACRLTEMDDAVRGRVVRVSDDDPARLRRFADVGIVPGAVVSIKVWRRSGNLVLSVDQRPDLTLTDGEANAVWVDAV